MQCVILNIWYIFGTYLVHIYQTAVLHTPEENIHQEGAN